MVKDQGGILPSLIKCNVCGQIKPSKEFQVTARDRICSKCYVDGQIVIAIPPELKAKFLAAARSLKRPLREYAGRQLVEAYDLCQEFFGEMKKERENKEIFVLKKKVAELKADLAKYQGRRPSWFRRLIGGSHA